MEGNKITIPKLLGQSNYEIWSLRMQSVLIEKGLGDYIIASFSTTGLTEDNVREIKLKADRALALIRLSISDGPLLQIRNIITPLEAWNSLKNLYSPQGFSSEFILFKDLFNTTLENSLSIEDYLNSIKRITDDLTSRNLKLPDKLIVAWILNNLTEEYNGFTSIITQSIRLNNSVNLETLFSSLIDESKRLSTKESNYSLNTKGYSKGNKSKINKKCNFCKKPGHLEANCFKKNPTKKPKDKEEEIALTSLLSTMEDKWILDSGATNHISFKREYFTKLEDSNQTIQWGNSSNTLKAIGRGTIRLESPIGVIKLENVYLVPEFSVNLISLSTLIAKGAQVSFNKQSCLLNLKNKSLNAILRNGLYLLPFKAITSTEFTILNSNIPNSNLWHQRLGHIGETALNYLPKAVKELPKEAESTMSLNTKECEICLKSKFKATISREASTKKEHFLDLITADLCGPIPIGLGGYRYFLSLLEASSRWIESYPLRSKEEVYSKLKEYIRVIENNSNRKIKVLKTDNGTEFINKRVKELLTTSGIEHQLSAPYTPEQNGLIERTNLTLLNKIRSLINESNLSKELWPDALKASVYLYNRTPHSFLEYITPYEKRFNKKPDISYIKIWGSISYYRNPKALKLEERSTLGVLIGYGSNQYKIYNPETKRTIWTRDIKILEGKYYNTPITSSKELEEITLLEEPIEEQPSTIRQLPQIQDDLGSEDELSLYTFNSTITIKDPLSYKEAILSSNKDKWIKAMEKEVNSLKELNTWTLVDLPIKRKALKGRWVYKTKLNKDGSIDKYKARWVAKGFLQKYGIDYTETFSNTVKPMAYRLLFILGTYLDWEIEQWDIKSAFTNSPINEEIYIIQPTGFEDSKSPNKVCRLNKALYGLKQSARQWYYYLKELLQDLGFYSITSDQSIFINPKTNIIVTSHIDDLLLFSKNRDAIRDLKIQLSKRVEITDLGPTSYYLGIEINRDRKNKTISLS